MTIYYGQGFLPYSNGRDFVPHDCPFNLVAPYNLVGWFDPTHMGDDLLRTRELSENIANTRSHFEVQETSGINVFGADSFPSTINIGSTTGNFQMPPITLTPGAGGTYPMPGGGTVNPFGPTYPVGPTNPVQPTYPTTPTTPGGNAGGAGGASNGELNPPEAEDYSSQLNARLSLIEKYCDRWGKIVDVEKIKKEYANDPEAGVKHCDDILNNKFDQGKLEKIVGKEYKAFIESHIEKGEKVSNEWVEIALKNGLDTPNFSTSGVNKNTVLDVIGTFVTNKDVKNGKVSLENIFESPKVTASLVESMKQKADEFLLDEKIDDDIKEQLVDLIEGMRNAYDDFESEPSIEKRTTLIESFMEAFAIMREEQAKRNDEAAPQYYGLPEDSEIEYSYFSDRATEEINAHNNRRRLSRSI